MSAEGALNRCLLSLQPTNTVTSQSHRQDPFIETGTMALDRKRRHSKSFRGQARVPNLLTICCIVADPLLVEAFPVETFSHRNELASLSHLLAPKITPLILIDRFDQSRT